jgi:hypothetical protein
MHQLVVKRVSEHVLSANDTIARANRAPAGRPVAVG